MPHQVVPSLCPSFWVSQISEVEGEVEKREGEVESLREERSEVIRKLESAEATIEVCFGVEGGDLGHDE